MRPDNIQASAVETAKLDDDAVTEAKIADDSVTVAKLDSGSATDGHVATADGSGGVALRGPDRRGRRRGHGHNLGPCVWRRVGC